MQPKRLFYHKTHLYQGLNEAIIQHVGHHQTILDVGCAEGRLGQFLKKHHHAKVYGLDIATTSIQKAKKKLDHAYCLDVEKTSIPFPSKSFDVIICADILEHLFDPLSVLKKLKPYLKKNGVFLLSIPNIANLKVRWDLLLGKFDYQPDGIMDNSHLHFYTQKTAQKLVLDAGLRIRKLDFSPGFSFFFLQGRILTISFFKQLLALLTKLRPTLFCRQFIIIAKV